MSTATKSEPSSKETASPKVSGESLKNGARSLAEDTRDCVSQTAGAIADSAKQASGQARMKIVNAAEHSQDFAAEECQRCVEGIRRNPLTAIGIASLVGVVIGLGLGLQSSRRD